MRLLQNSLNFIEKSVIHTSSTVKHSNIETKSSNI
jgi:hypothetical protein